MEDDQAPVDLIVADDGQQPNGVWSLIQRASKLDITRTQAQKMFKSGRLTVIVGLPRDRAGALKVEFEALGATVQLGPWLGGLNRQPCASTGCSRGHDRRVQRPRRPLTVRPQLPLGRAGP